MKTQSQITLSILAALLLTATSCQKTDSNAEGLSYDESASAEEPNDNDSQEGPVAEKPIEFPPIGDLPTPPTLPQLPEVPPIDVPTNPTDPNFKYEKLYWEITKKGNKKWSDFVHKTIEEKGSALLSKKPVDVEMFCRRYDRLNKKQKVNFWGMLISAMSWYESAHKPTTRYVEKTMGIDPITKKQVVSEGLMQLSYQDVRSYPFCNEFDWSKDKYLSPTDPRKTIFDPNKNLKCAIQIMNRQIDRRVKITERKGAYWAVIIENGRYEKIKEIAQITNRLSFCN